MKIFGYSYLVCMISLFYFAFPAAASCNIDAQSPKTAKAMLKALEADGKPLFDAKNQIVGVRKGNKLIGCDPNNRTKWDGLQCVYDFYRYRSPVFEGCSFEVDSNGVRTVYRYQLDGKVYTGQPHGWLFIENAKLKQKNICPKSVVKNIDMDLKSQGLSWNKLQQIMSNEFDNFKKLGNSQIDLIQSGESYEGRISALGGVSFLSDFKEIDFGLMSKVDGYTVYFSGESVSTLSLISFDGAFDFRGGCR